MLKNKNYLVEQHCPSIDHIIPAQDINTKANALTKFVYAICELQIVISCVRNFQVCFILDHMTIIKYSYIYIYMQ